MAEVIIDLNKVTIDTPEYEEYTEEENIDGLLDTLADMIPTQEKKMKLSEYITQAKKEIDDFEQLYVNGNKNDPEMWPLEADEGEWVTKNSQRGLVDMFSLTPEQRAKANEWIKEHECSVTYVGTAGGRITYQFTPTGIGIGQNVKCACGKSLSLTDFDTW